MVKNLEMGISSSVEEANHGKQGLSPQCPLKSWARLETTSKEEEHHLEVGLSRCAQSNRVNS